MITEAISKVLGYKNGYLLTEGFLVKCSGIDRHLIATLDDHLPGTSAHAIGNPEFTDDLWLIDPSQSAIDWSNPKCCICGAEIAS